MSEVHSDCEMDKTSSLVIIWNIQVSNCQNQMPMHVEGREREKRKVVLKLCDTSSSSPFWQDKDKAVDFNHFTSSG